MTDRGDPTTDGGRDEEVGGPVRRSEDQRSRRLIAVPIERVWAALVDPRTYPLWLVGAQRIRRVDLAWPEVGSAFHHTVGLWPLLVRDRTTVVELDPPHRLGLEAGVSVLGDAAVTFELTEDGPDRTRVAIAERAERGPVRAVWRLGGRAAMALGIWGRNQESLRRLADGLERGTIGPVGGSSG